VVVKKKYGDDRVILDVPACVRSLLEEFESNVLENMESVFNGKLSGISLAKLYVSSVVDEGIVVDLEDDPECVVDEECTYDIVLVCDNVFIAKGNSSFVSIENKIYDSRIETMHGFLEL
jgi:hypothetical protein